MQPYPPQYAPQYPSTQTQPGYPAQYPTAPPQYAPAPQGAYGYPVAPAPQAPPVPAIPGTLDGFYGQRAAGSKAWVFKDRPIGTAYVGVVARPVTNADVRQATDNDDRPVTFPDGSPKWVMVVPMRVQPSAEFPDGEASWWCKGQARDELVRAMAEAGAPAGPPEAGAVVYVRLAAHRPSRKGNPQFVYQIVYTRPTGAAPEVAAMAIPNVVQPQSPVYQPAPPPVTAGYQAPYVPQPTHVMGMDGQPVPALNIGPNVTPSVQQYAPPPAQPAYAAPPQQYAPLTHTETAPPAYVPQGLPQGYAQPAPQYPAPAQPASAQPALTPQQQALMAQLTGAQPG